MWRTRCDVADGRCKHRCRSSLRRRWKRGNERHALGCWRSGFSTKINARTNVKGLAIGIVITPGQAKDVTAFPAPMRELDHEHMLGGTGHDATAVRQETEKTRGAKAHPHSITSRRQSHPRLGQSDRTVLQSFEKLTPSRNLPPRTRRALCGVRTPCRYPHRD